MATTVIMKQKSTGLLRMGYFGFSWTTLFFGFFPALFRADFITFIGGFIVSSMIAILTKGVGMGVIFIIWAFMYNKYYTRNLLERGYVFADTEARNIQASIALDVDLQKYRT